MATSRPSRPGARRQPGHAPAAADPTAADAADSTPRHRGRAPGRPNAHSPDQRARLLQAALDCFAAQGIAAASLRDIARAAGVTPALAHYYFGDKAQLLEAVVAERVLPIFVELRQTLLQTDAGAGALIAGFVNGIAALVARHPWLPPLWIREVVSEGGALRELLTTRIGPMLAQQMAARFAQAQQRGELNAGLDPRLLMVSLVGLTMFPAAGAPIWKRLFQAEELDMEAVRVHTLALLERGLELKP